MKLNSVVNDLKAKIVSHLKGVKSKEVQLARVRYARGQPIFHAIEEENTAVEIFGHSVKGQKPIEIFHVQVSKQAAEAYSALVEPNPTHPVLVKLTEEEIAER